MAAPSYEKIFLECNNLQILEKLQKYPRDVLVEYRHYRNRNSLLHLAIKYERIEVIKYLVNIGCDTCAQNSLAQQPLHEAAQSCAPFTPAVIKLLLRKGARVDCQDSRGFLPLHYAAQSRSCYAPKMVKLLLDRGSPIDRKGKSNLLALHCAASSCGSWASKVVQLLLDHGTPVDCADFEYKLPLHHAVMNKTACTPQVVKLLLDYGSPVDYRDYSRTTYENRLPIHYCVKNKAPHALEVLNLLLEYGSPIDRSVLNLALKNRCNDTFEILVATLVKIQFLGKEVPGIDEEFINEDSFLKKNFDACTEEIDRMKTCKVTGNIYLVDILTDSLNQLVRYTRNEEFVRKFTKTDYEDKYPSFCKILKFRYRLAKEKRILLDDATEVLSKILPLFSTRYDIAKKISCYLRPRDLYTLMSFANY